MGQGSNNKQLHSICLRLPLDRTRHSLRLLTLSPGRRSDRIHCSLAVVDLDNGPAYEALSYAWRKGPSRHTIVLNGHLLRIRRNLYEALLRLRYPRRSRILWIDALCIDQSSILERNHQVGQMGNIYRKASMVVAWLGEASVDSDMALDAILRFSKDGNFSQSRMSSDRAAKRLDGRWITEPLVNAFKNLMQRPWWKRIWCVQEIVLAQKAAIVCGRRSLPWETFLVSSRNYFKHRDRYEYGPRVSEVYKYLIPAKLFGCVAGRDFVPSKQSMIWILDAFGDHECSDDRDRVYSLLATGCFEDAVQPDYSLSASRVYQHFALATIYLLGSLDVLHFVRYTENQQDIPSWVPDWRPLSTEDNPRSPPYSILGDASAGSKPDVCILKDGELLLKGYFVDSIQNISSRQQFLHVRSKVSDVNLHYSHWEEIADVGRPEQRSADTAGDQYEDFARTVVQNMQWVSGFPEVLETTGYARFRQWRQWLQLGSGLIQEIPSDVCTMLEMLTYLGSLQFLLFFKTQQGNFGTGPFGMRHGDSVYVLAGGKCAYILRPEGNEYFKDGVWHPYYILIGAAYVDGIMNGEVVQDIMDGKKEWQEICLR